MEAYFDDGQLLWHASLAKCHPLPLREEPLGLRAGLDIAWMRVMIQLSWQGSFNNIERIEFMPGSEQDTLH
ncbi:MAG: hypothetical protein ACFC1C_02470 [Candidatus Malihini olakiniferum]